MNKITILIIFSFVTVSSASMEEIEKKGQFGGSVTFQCPLKSGQKAVDTKWLDTVYTNTESPVLIYSESGLNQDHPNAENFQVDGKTKALTINKLNEDSAGTYICQNGKGEKMSKIEYYLSISGPVKCSGQKDLNKNDQTLLSCSADYVGKDPQMEWTRAGKTVESVSHFDIHIAQMDLRLDSVSEEDDDVEFRCDYKMAAVVEHCAVKLSVKHGANKVWYSPSSPRINVGQQMRCVSNGNPASELTLTSASFPADLPIKSAKNEKSFVVPAEWLGKEVVLDCSAANTFNGKQFKPTNQTRFFVDAPIAKANISHASSIQSIFLFLLFGLFPLILC